MKPATLSVERKRLLKRFANAGGVVEFLFFECEATQDNIASEATHRRAILAGMDFIRQRSDEQLNMPSGTFRSESSDYPQISFDKELMTGIRGRRIDYIEFLGPRYSIERKGLIVRGKEKLLNVNFFYKDPARQRNILPEVEDDRKGFAYAFSSPPYPIHLKAEELGELLEKFLTVVLGGVSGNSLIFQWPTNWSNFFETGDEWWGSFLWSFANPSSQQIAVIAASASD